MDSGSSKTSKGKKAVDSAEPLAPSLTDEDTKKLQMPFP